MATLLKMLDLEYVDTLHDMCLSRYLDGQCYEFAIALHRGLGWPMVGLMQGEVVRHVLVHERKKIYHDTRGRVSLDKMGQPFGIGQPYDLREVSETDLKTIRPVGEHNISTARRLAESVWPDLPWKDSEARRAKAFADELEALSRKHKFWIRSAMPSALPILAEGGDDEAGYTLIPTADAGGFQIDRRFK